MADPHHQHHDPIEDNIETHPVRLAIGVVIGAAALIIGLYFLVQLAIGGWAARSMKDEPGMSDKAVRERIAPVAQEVVDPNAAQAPAPAAAPTTPVAAVTLPAAPQKAAAAPAAGDKGKATFDSVCTACHSTGAAGAPKLGDKAAWAPRIKQGMDALHNSALKGKGAMPPKGGNPTLSDDDVKAAVDYMVNAAK